MLKQHGLTLVELMITVAIASILITVGAPGISSILQQNQVIADINNISSVARVARFTAVDESASVVMCPTNNYTKCESDWSLAKMVFLDADNDGQLGGAETLLVATDPVSSSNTISGVTGSLVFRADGSVSQQASIQICPASGNNKYASALLISLWGRLAIATDDDDNGIREDISGTDLSCS
ncbi:GspH/FimT family pseudopilin [Salinimonas marina]|uniref:Type II secretion system protein H n=1 Tax=Salinimonas marina TaxID=2785918 RepID=A0A7S9DYW5_9ALTE|nr:GspH/FimT family pseudopilin [Salinimonas marina]QPG06507.1 GspH/FimT family pseudopilin [Salinimonas marina]